MMVDSISVNVRTVAGVTVKNGEDVRNKTDGGVSVMTDRARS